MSKAFLTIQQAADQVGVSRQSVWRKCKTGIIPSSIDKRTGSTVIQVVDLIAHYGELQPRATSSHATKATSIDTKKQSNGNTATLLLQQELERLKDALAEKQRSLEELKREVREEKAQWIEEKNWLRQLIDRQALLLGSTPAPAAEQPEDKSNPAKSSKPKKQKRDRKTGRFT